MFWSFRATGAVPLWTSTRSRGCHRASATSLRLQGSPVVTGLQSWAAVKTCRAPLQSAQVLHQVSPGFRPGLVIVSRLVRKNLSMFIWAGPSVFGTGVEDGLQRAQRATPQLGPNGSDSKINWHQSAEDLHLQQEPAPVLRAWHHSSGKVLCKVQSSASGSSPCFCFDSHDLDFCSKNRKSVEERKKRGRAVLGMNWLKHSPKHTYNF